MLLRLRALRREALGLALALVLAAAVMPAQQMVTETRDPAQVQDEDFAKSVKDWTTQPYFISPLVDHLPKVNGVPSPKDVLGYHIGAPGKLTYYADILKYYRALAAAVPGRVKIETIGKSDEDRELVVVWISSDENIKTLTKNRDNLGRIADPRRSSPAEIRQLIATAKPQYHLMGGLHSGETGPSEMLMELAYRLATETSPLIKQIRDNVYVSITPVADPDGRDRNVDWFYRNRELGLSAPGAGGRGGAAPQATGGETTGDTPAAGGGGGAGGRGAVPGVPYWGKYVFHDNNRDINLSQVSMRAITDWYFTAHPPIMHDLHESQPLLYTYSGAAPQNPNLDPILFAELPFFSNFELSQMTKWGMPGVYTHAFMDGWSPGYLGSVAYNHNGMMRMYRPRPATTSPLPPSPASATPPAAAQRPVRAHATNGCLFALRFGRPRPAANATAPEGGAGRGGRGRGGAGGGRQQHRPRKLTRDGAPPATCRPDAERLPRARQRDGAAASRASGIAGCPFRRARSPTGRAATTPITCRPASCPACSSRPCSRTWSWRTSTRRPAIRLSRGRQTRRSGSSFPCSATERVSPSSSTSCGRRELKSAARPRRSRSPTAPSQPAPT